MNMGLCRGRHEMPVDNYIFEHEINPLDIDGLNKIVENKFEHKPERINLYVTGITVALVTVINYESVKISVSEVRI